MTRLTDAFDDLSARAEPAVAPSVLLAGARSEAGRRNRRRRAVVAGLGLGVAAAVTVGLGIWSGDNEPGVRTQNLPVATAPPVGPPTTERRPADAPPAVDETGLPDAPEQAPPGSSTAPDGSWTDPPAEDGTTWQDQDPRPSATTTSPARPGAAPESGR